MTSKETYHWYKEHGICVKCHQADAVRGQVLCLNCRDISRERSKMISMKNYYWYKEHGICVKCHQADAIRGQTFCPNCRDADRERQRRYRERIEGEKRVERLKKQREQNKRRYAEKKELGICVACERAAVPGRTYCSIHLAKARYRRTMTAGWKAPNECRYCHEPRVEGFALCAKHLPRMQETGRKVGKLPIPPWHPWRTRYKADGGVKCKP